MRCLMPEKLLERAIAMGASFDEVRRPDQRTLVLRCNAVSAGILRRLCERFSIPAQVICRGGVSALAEIASRRATLLLGLALCAAICVLFLGRIWLVDVAVDGEDALKSRTAICAYLEGLGIRPGASRDMDAELLARAIEAEVPGLSHVNVKLQGVRLLVDASEEEPVPGLYDIDAARDLVASRDGIVLSASARFGELCVQPGDAVYRGQLLIRGEERLTAEDTRPIAALGEVQVRAWFVGEAELPLRRTRENFTGRIQNSASLRIWRLDWPLYQAEGFASERVETVTLPIGRTFIPVEILRKRHQETEIVTENTDVGLIQDHLKRLAMASATLQLAKQDIHECEILRTWVDWEPKGNVLTARAVIEVRTDAAIPRDALYDERQWTE